MSRRRVQKVSGAALESSNPNLARGACVGAAVVGALVWGGVSHFSGYEIGWLAVGVGALTGWACVQASGRGTVMAATAAAFALLAILGGKYMATVWSIGKFVRGDSGVQAHYEELVRDSKDLVALGDEPDDELLEQYMEDHGYVDFTVEEFRDTAAASVREFATEHPTVDSYASAIVDETMGHLSLQAIYVSDNPKDLILDLLFLGLGVGAAFQLVMNRSNEEALAINRAEREQARAEEELEPAE